MNKIVFVATLFALGCGTRSEDLKDAIQPIEPPPEISNPETKPMSSFFERSADDQKRDEARKPKEVLDFIGVKEGDRVVDLMAADGWYTDVLARRVGTKGKVYAMNNPLMVQYFGEKLVQKVNRLNGVAEVIQPVSLDGELAIPEGARIVLMSRIYHDLYHFEGVDRDGMNRAIFEGLEPGGIFAIIDYHSADGRGSQDAKSLHRIEKRTVQSEIERTGFVLDAESSLLSRPDDDRTQTAFGKGDSADRFVLKFKKPE